MSHEMQAVKDAVAALDAAYRRQLEAREAGAESPPVPAGLSLREALYTQCYAARLAFRLQGCYRFEKPDEAVMRDLAKAAWLDACGASSMYERFVADTKEEGV
jgi:hypothetical protein